MLLSPEINRSEVGMLSRLEGRSRHLLCGALGMCCALALAVHPARAQQREQRPVFQLDPVGDSTYLAGTFLVAATCEALIDTGEIEAQAPDAESELIFIDAWIAKRDSASLRHAQTSDLGVVAVMAWAITDTVFAGVGKRPDSALTYLTLYLESGITTWVISNLFKLAVRRPRPRAYIELRETGSVTPDTQESLSFYSLHTAMAATLAATATYMAFTRDDPEWVRWVILGGSIIATSIVGVGRILSGAHFTTDVLGGLGAGVAVGVLVPHLHRAAPVRVVPNVERGGGTLSVVGRF